ncbi:MAG TPA: aminotransferase class V-fold PLP-dependent enzyme [Gemmatimonadales bacterium]|nr:aminotransferase class V-fold PLP-dependent enzyme [Gemmatimonadales bacterium]
MTLASSVEPRALGGLARYRSEFPIFRDKIYLNTCSLGPLGERSRRKVAEFLDIWQSRGASAWYDVWWEALADLRARYGRIINAAPGEIALAPSISVALSAVAESLDYAKRPKVVITSLDFPTVAYQWLAKADSGVELVVVDSPDKISVPVEAIARAIDDRTALVVTSHVYFTSGAIQDITRIAAAAHAHGALCLIDAYQSVGQIPVDVRETGVDAFLAGGLKWLLGGPGIVFLYMKEAVTRRLEPRISGWFGQREQFAFDPRSLTFHDDARRFEMGTPALAAVYAQLGGLEYIEEIGVPAIRQTTTALTEDLIATMRAAGFTPKVAAEPARRSAIVMVPTPDPAASVRYLAAGGIIVDSRPGHVRFSPFFYNVQDDHVRATERLASQPAH